MALNDLVVKQLDYLILEGSKIAPVTYSRTYEFYGKHDYPGWITQVDNFLHNLVGQQSPYYVEFKSARYESKERIVSLLSILNALKHDYENKVLHDFKSIYVAEVFSDFLEMSQQLLDEGRHDPAAMLIGAVLEDGLRKLCDKKSVAFKKGDQLTTLKDKLLQGRAINALTSKKLEVWIKLRNHAAHGEFDKYTIDDVKEMQKGVEDFLANNL